MRTNRMFPLLLACFVFLFTSCHHHSQHAFYYWKSTFQLSPAEQKYLGDLKVTKLYVKFFDVDLDPVSHAAMPIAKIRFASPHPQAIALVPVVFIRNKVFFSMHPDEVARFADRVLQEVKALAQKVNVSFQELQIDCDWSDRTHARYFAFLKHLGQKLKKEELLLSATIRLHQVKYKEMTGVPPVDKGMLMYYNMGKINLQSGENSIFDAKIAAQYDAFCRSYPLPLDAVLPAFSWGIHYRGNQLLDLLESSDYPIFVQGHHYKKLSQDVYQVVVPHFYKGSYFMEGDEVKLEQITADGTIRAAKQMASKIKSPVGTIAFFHFDSLTMTKYETKDFQKAYSYFD